MTDWNKLEKGETHGVFKFRRGDAVCEISTRRGLYRVWAWREATPEKKQGKEITKMQAAAIARQAREAADCEILFNYGEI